MSGRRSSEVRDFPLHTLGHDVRGGVHLGLLKLNYPTRHGVTTDWKDMQLLWQHVYSELNVPHDQVCACLLFQLVIDVISSRFILSLPQHPVLLTEPPLNPTRNRAQAAEIFFETFNVPALSVQVRCPPPVLLPARLL